MSKELFARLHTAVIGLAELEKGDPAPTEPEVQEMTAEQFVDHVTSEIEKAAKDEPKVRVARLKHLAGQIEVLQKEFVGGTPVTMKVTPFRDPGQVKTTEKTINPTSTLPNATNFSQNPAPPTTQGAGSTPSGGKMPPIGAPSGAGGAAAVPGSISKALELLNKTIAVMAKEAGVEVPEEKPAEGEKPTTEATSEKPAEGEKPTTEVQKSENAFWPADMSTPFGMGETKDDETPEWGIDGQKATADKPAPAATDAK